MRVLVVDVGGTHVKLLATGQKVHRECPSGPTLTAEQMVAGVKSITADWTYEAASIGYPGPVLHGRPLAEPRHLGGGWVGFDYRSAFGCPVKDVNDAAMQALGSYRGGKMLFLGLGTGLGSTMIVDGTPAESERQRRAAPAHARRRRRDPRRAPDRGGGRNLPRLLEEPRHRRDGLAALSIGRGVRPSGAHRRDVPRSQDQRDG